LEQGGELFDSRSIEVRDGFVRMRLFVKEVESLLFREGVLCFCSGVIKRMVGYLRVGSYQH
jgi:hypothetical protein